MGLFLRWVALRESNAAKRRIKAALRGEQPPLPGSYAACPRTDADAMDVASKTGLVRKKYMCKCGCGGDSSKCTCGPDCSCRKYHENKTPDYSIDRWIDMANDLGDDLTALRQNSDKDEKELDKEIDGKKKETEKDAAKEKTKTKVTDNKDEKEEEEADHDKEEKELWKTVKKHLGHKDRGKESSAKSAASSSRSSQSSSSTSRTR